MGRSALVVVGQVARGNGGLPPPGDSQELTAVAQMILEITPIATSGDDRTLRRGPGV